MIRVETVEVDLVDLVNLAKHRIHIMTVKSLISPPAQLKLYYVLNLRLINKIFRGLWANFSDGNSQIFL